MLSTSFLRTAPRPPRRSHALLASRWTGMVGPSRPALARQRTTASDRWGKIPTLHAATSRPRRQAR
eukprot:2880594-Alexandrium_andersonii.AAC.1